MLGAEIRSYFLSRGITVEVFNRRVVFKQSLQEQAKFIDGYDCIIHAAAKTNLEDCENNYRDCYRDNTLLTERLAIASSNSNCKFIYISSTGVYGAGNPSLPYTEFDAVEPTTHYHNSKRLGENAVNSYCKNPLILRAGWLFGGVPENEKNFVARRIEEAVNAKKKYIFSNKSQLGNPTSVHDFAITLHEMVMNDETGTFNLINTNTASRFEYVSEIIKLAELDVKVRPIGSENFERKAKVSHNEAAIPLKLEMLGYAKLPSWSHSLEKYIKTDLRSWIEALKNDK